MQAALTQTKVAVAAPSQVARRPAQRVACSAVPQKLEEQSSRRAALGLFGAAVLSLTAAAAEAAMPAPKNSSLASKEGYDMEGTKKQGISAKRKKALLKKLRANAEKAAAGK